MPDRLKSRGRTKRSHWSYRLGVGLGANNNTQKKCTATKPHRRPKLTQDIAPVKQKNMCEVGIK
jgi:hypothetical protein